ncbi:unnamed protein product [Phytomonas sp. Hart1]|nr:unnamed protein product [Phytomonas sp. Hart1]|eukprot:CCW67657.1 unnamed protein product [Phytomonas sp. isolate Hart1]
MVNTSNKSHNVFELIPKYSTATNEEVSQEIEIILNTFENAKVVGQNKVHKKLRIPISSETRPTFHALLDITVVEGYPYVPPRVELMFPAGTHPKGPDGLTKEEATQLKEELSSSIQPCRSVGMPCMMQIVSTVLQFVSTERSPVAEVQDRDPNVPTSSAVSKSPALTPVPLKAKDALRLSVLALHLLRKCCYMRDPASRVEWNSNFDWLSSYLIEKTNVFPRAVRGLLPWRGEGFAKAFANEIQTDEYAVSQWSELKEWFWKSEELPLRIQQGSEGRYQNEFIQQKLLGSGGFAPVYMCRKKIDGRSYAVKKIVMKDNQSEKIIREVQTLAALNHKNIVRYYDAWVEDGCDEELKRFIEDDELSEKGGIDKTAASACVTRLVSDYSSSDSSHDSLTASSSSMSDEHSDTEDEESDESSCEVEFHNNGNDPNIGPASVHSDPSRNRLQTLYIQMELCSATSLRHLIDESDKGCGIFASERGEKVAASILRQLLVVIAHTHHENIVHRDLKPDNVLFEMGNSQVEGEIGTIRVADFGLARVMSGLKQTASAYKLDDISELIDVQHEQNANFPTGNCGSVLYCAPEQEKGIYYGFKVDEFSIGMIALEMWLSILGKGFRERFNIMEQAWVKGTLPDWFIQCKPPIAEVIASLLEHDQQNRRTCEEVLSTAELPGDPVDIIEALETIDRYGERFACRVIQKIQKLGIQYRKPPPQLRAMAQFLGSVACAQAAQAVNVVGILHGSMHVGFVDPLVLINPDLNELGVDVVTDTAGRSYSFTALPQLPVASFLGMQENATIGSFHCFYHKVRSYAVFVTPMLNSDVFSEGLIDPFLSLIHLISFMELTEPINIIISHADWLNAVYPRLGLHQCQNDFSKLRTSLDSTEKFGPAISLISETLSKVGLVCSFNRDELLRKFSLTMINAIHLFGKHLSSHISIILDPTLFPSETLNHHHSIDRGIILECRTASGIAFAFGCSMDNYISKCTVTNPDMNGYSIVVDIYEMATNWKHLYIPTMEGILDGVAIRRQDLYSQSHQDNVVEAAVKLWKSNTPAYLSIDNDLHALVKKMKGKKLRWVLFDGKRLVPASCIHQNKAPKYSDISIDKLCDTVRSLSLKDRQLSSKTNADVIFISMNEDFQVAEEAKEILNSMTAIKWSPIVIMNIKLTDIEACFDEKKRSVELSQPQQALFQWLGANNALLGVTPIYSFEDGKITFFINHKKFKAVQKKEKGKRKKK